MSGGVKQDEILFGESAPVARSSVLYNTASFIIATEFCERLAYYGFAGSLVLFFETKLDMSNEESVNQFYFWNGAVYITPLLGGYIADTYLGRFKTILYFSVVYLVGLGTFLIGSIPTNIQTPLIFLGMYIVALGAGGIKPNASTMGADQFDLAFENDRKESKLFFSYFYWSINLGALVSYTLVAYICQYGISFLGGEDWGFFIGYLIPTIMLGVGVAVFLSGSSRYKKSVPEGSIINKVAGILYEAAITRRHVKVEKDSDITDRLTANNGAKRESGQAPDNIEREIDEGSLWLDRASLRFGGSFDPMLIRSVKFVVRLLPFLSVMIPYWGIYGQTKTAFQIQACQMNANLGSVQLPVSAMNIFNNVAILILVPVFERYLYPGLKRWGRELSMLHKIGVGFLFAIFAMVLAAIIEYFRREFVHTSGTYENVSARDNISPCR
jgi:peptide/histidine transporter 3/4